MRARFVLPVLIAGALLGACSMDESAGGNAGPPPQRDAASQRDSAALPDAEMGCPATAMLAPGDSTRTITVGGIERTYLVHVPPSYAGTTAVPVVFDMHPKGVTASTWLLATPWSSIADREGFIVVRPDGYGQTWNVGRCCDPAMSTVDDVAFVRAMVAALERDACVDSKRIYATGCSNGGGMAYRLACDAADIIAAIAPVDFDCLTGPTNTPSCANCNPVRPVSECQFRGLLDTSAPYNGGPTTVVPGIDFPGAQANFSNWGMLNSCTGQPQAQTAHSTCQTYPTCGGGVETTLCTDPLGLHCTGYYTFGTADIAWEMFSRHRLP
jgi:polyhydroxybutyrate depolymerase